MKHKFVEYTIYKCWIWNLQWKLIDNAMAKSCWMHCSLAVRIMLSSQLRISSALVSAFCLPVGSFTFHILPINQPTRAHCLWSNRVYWINYLSCSIFLNYWFISYYFFVFIFIYFVYTSHEHSYVKIRYLWLLTTSKTQTKRAIKI